MNGDIVRVFVAAAALAPPWPARLPGFGRCVRCRWPGPTCPGVLDARGRVVCDPGARAQHPRRPAGR